MGSVTATYASVVQPTEKNIFVTSYGALGNGSHNDTTAIQAALTAAAAVNGSTVMFPSGVFMINATLIYSGQTSIVGAGDSDNGTIIRVIGGSALATPMMATNGWYNNSTTGDYPVKISDIKFDGNSAMSGASGHGLVAMNYQSSFDRLSITAVSGDGFRFTAFTQNGAHITNTCNECKISRIQVRTCGGRGIFIHDDGTTLNSCTDGFMENCIVTGAGTLGIDVEMAPGWYVSGCHIYGTGQDGLYMRRCYASSCVNNYIDGYGSGSASFIAGICMEVLDGRASMCIGNRIGYESSTATGPSHSLRITGAGSATSICYVDDNDVRGNNATGSIGYVFSANVSQQSSPWIVYFTNNQARNVLTYSSIDAYTTFGETAIYNHVNSYATALAAVAGANAGTSPPVPVKTNCSDVSGKITFGTGTSPASGIFATITFAQAYLTYAPSVILTPCTTAAATTSYYVTVTTTGFNICMTSGYTASQANTVYGYNYQVMR